MKKNIYLIFIIPFLALNLAAQSPGNDIMKYRISNYYHVKRANFIWMQRDTGLRNSGIDEVRENTYTFYTNRSKKTNIFTSVSYYDSAGYLIKKEILNTRSKAKLTEVYEHDTAGRLINFYLSKNEKFLYRVNKNYTADGKLLLYDFFQGKKLRLKTRNYYKYENGKLQNMLVYRKDTGIMKYRYRYNYLNDTGKLLLTEITDSKGKVIYKIDYSCNISGELTKKENKKEMRICKSHIELENGHYQEMYEQFSNGEHWRYFYEYDSTKSLVNMLTYRGKSGDKLERKEIHDRSGDTSTIYVEMYNTGNGKLSSSFLTLRDSENKVLSENYSYYNSKGRMTDNLNSTYIYKGKQLVETRTNNLKRPRKEQVSEYEYRRQTGS